MTQESDILLPSAPREITSRIRRRAWSEPRVRFWVFAAIVLSVCGVGFIANGLRAGAHERWLIDDGVHIDAIIIVADGEPVKGKQEPPESLVSLRFIWKGQDYEPRAEPLLGRKEFITVGSTIPIHVNPKDPSDWTWLNEPFPLRSRAIGGIIALPMAVLALLWAMLRRARLLRIWRDGIAEEALIVETRFTATAPRCRAARVTPADEGDARIFTVYIPPRLANLQRGDSLHMLRPSAQSSNAISVAWFE